MTWAHAESLIVDSELADAYHFVDTYETIIDAPPAVVWPQIANIRSWMDAASMIHEAGPYGAEGEVFRLYEGQDYFAEAVKLIPNTLLLLANLPANVEGEDMVGIAMITLTDIGGQTLVSSFMSRQFHWPVDAENPLRARRESAEYREFNRAAWEDRFFVRLHELVEQSQSLESTRQ